jgi:hypothetical protein
MVHRPYGQKVDSAALDSQEIPPVLPGTRETRLDLASLAANATELDRQVGFTLDALDETALRTNTLSGCVRWMRR